MLGDHSKLQSFVDHYLPETLRVNMSEQQQKLVFSIIEFLNQCIQDGTVKTDDKEGLEVAGRSSWNFGL